MPRLGARGRAARTVVSAYLAAFLLAAAGAPHLHKNDIADLLLDGPSDSGVFLDVSPVGPRDSGPVAESLRYVDDDPCLACFLSDFTATAATAIFDPSPPTPRVALLPISAERGRSAGIRLRAARSPPAL